MAETRPGAAVSTRWSWTVPGMVSSLGSAQAKRVAAPEKLNMGRVGVFVPRFLTSDALEIILTPLGFRNSGRTRATRGVGMTNGRSPLQYPAEPDRTIPLRSGSRALRAPGPPFYREWEVTFFGIEETFFATRPAAIQLT